VHETDAQDRAGPRQARDLERGTEFINHHLFEYCEAHRITFTRSRSGNKNDGAHIEQKNWTHVRELVGYLRFDTPGELDLLNGIWELDHGFTNHLLTQQKLVDKHCEGSKVTKRYDAAQTPATRALYDPTVAEDAKASMRQTLSTISPSTLSNEITALCKQLERLALSKAPAPVKSRVNQAFNHRDHPEDRGEAMNHRSRRI
jgi:hypothetical protein